MEPGSKIADRYRVERLIGRGGMSQVYEAVDTKFGALVALKLARPPDADFDEFLARFKREAKIGRLLGRHSSRFVRALDWGQHDEELCYLVMDLVEGATDLDLYTGTLEQKLDRLAQAAQLVAEVHRRRIVHRDLKPANFLTSREGRIHLGDFGLAKLLDEEEDDGGGRAGITQSGLAMGTPYYMAPEQVDAKRVDERADLYAMGVMLFQALTGELPFEGSIGQLIAAHQEVLSGHRPTPRARGLRPDVPPALDQLCFQAMALELERRLPSIDALVAGLGVVGRGKATTTLQPRTRRQQPPPADEQPATRRLAPGEVAPPPPPAGRRPAGRLARPQPSQPPGPGGQTMGGQTMGGQTMGGQTMGGQTMGGQTMGGQTMGGQTMGGQTLGGQTMGRRPRPLPRGISRVPGSDNEVKNEQDGSLLVRVPGGMFQPDAPRAEGGGTANLARVEGFFIGKHPVTWAQYLAFCRATGREAPARRFDAADDHPVHNVSWFDAWAYCAWAGLRLPTELEWELAARGQDERPWPWGDAPPSPERCNYAGHPTWGGRGTSPVGAFPAGVSPFGCHDMVGNVLEWMADPDDPPPGPTPPPQKPSRALRGGAFRLDEPRCRPGHTIRLSPRAAEPHVGFRVACSLFRRPGSERHPSGDIYQSDVAPTPAASQVVIAPPLDEGRRVVKQVRELLPVIAQSVARTERREVKFVYGVEQRQLAFAVPEPRARFGYIEHRVKLDAARLVGRPTGLLNLLYAANLVNASHSALRCLISADRLRLRRDVFLSGRPDFTPDAFRAHIHDFLADWEEPFRILRKVQRGAPWAEAYLPPLPPLGEAEGILTLEELLETAGVESERLDENRLAVGFGDERVELLVSRGQVHAWLVVRPWEVPTAELLEVRQGGHAPAVEALVDELNELNHERCYTLAWDQRHGVIARALLAEDDRGALPPIERVLAFIDALQVERRAERFASLGQGA
ncbi:MAG: bifunctional serine/threonine-protein kinase/formylglycine-generating enzyme family protein [Planctomycetota bacterium]